MVDKKEVRKMMDSLGVSMEEATRIIEYDELVDKGSKVQKFELTPDQEKASALARRTTGKAEKKRSINVKKPADVAKEAIISELCAKIGSDILQSGTNPKILNKNRLLSFDIGEDSYELMLVKKNKKLQEKKRNS